MPAQSLLVLVMVGTDHHPFNRLIEWTDEWLRDRPDERIQMITQYGHTHAPRLAEGRDFVSRTELDDLLTRATVVVCHGGPSTIIETRRRGLMPIVLARSASLNEHVDDHQKRFAKLMSDRGLIRLVRDRALLHTAIDEALRKPLVVTGGDDMPDPAESALRLGKLVDELVSRPRRARRRWWPIPRQNSDPRGRDQRLSGADPSAVSTHSQF